MVSVVIPTYNRASLLKDAVGSAQSQTPAPGEILVVDDGSTDDSRRTAEGLAGISYVYQDNQGPSAARNRGLAHTHGEFVAFLDADDRWDNDFLRTLTGFLERHPELGFVFANWRGVDASGAATYADYMAAHPYYRQAGVVDGEGWHVLDPRQSRALFLCHSAAPSSALVVRRGHAALWDEAVRIGEDNLFLLDVLLRHDCGCAFTPRPLWSKMGSAANLFDGNRDAGNLARQHLIMARALLTRHRKALRAVELHRVRRGMARDLCDWAYWEAYARRPGHALRLYGQSLLAMPSWRCLKGALALLLARRRQSLAAPGS